MQLSKVFNIFFSKYTVAALGGVLFTFTIFKDQAEKTAKELQEEIEEERKKFSV